MHCNRSGRPACPGGQRGSHSRRKRASEAAAGAVPRLAQAPRARWLNLPRSSRLVLDPLGPRTTSRSMIGPSFTNSALIRSNSSSSVAPVPGPIEATARAHAIRPAGALFRRSQFDRGEWREDLKKLCSLRPSASPDVCVRAPALFSATRCCLCALLGTVCPLGRLCRPGRAFPPAPSLTPRLVPWSPGVGPGLFDY